MRGSRAAIAAALWWAALAAPAGANGTVVLRSEPPGAIVEVRGHVLGRTPLARELPAGRYVAKVWIPGRHPKWVPLRIVDGLTTRRVVGIPRVGAATVRVAPARAAAKPPKAVAKPRVAAAARPKPRIARRPEPRPRPIAAIPSPPPVRGGGGRQAGGGENLETPLLPLPTPSLGSATLARRAPPLMGGAEVFRWWLAGYIASLLMGLFAIQRPRPFPPAGARPELEPDAVDAAALRNRWWAVAMARLTARARTAEGGATQLYHLGVACQAHGDLVAAEAAYRTALRLEPAHGDAAFNLATVLEARGEHGLAVAAYRGLLQRAPDVPAARVNLALLYERLGMQAAADPLWRAGWRGAPGVAAMAALRSAARALTSRRASARPAAASPPGPSPGSPSGA